MQLIAQTHYPKIGPSGMSQGPLITISTQLILKAAEELGITYAFTPDSPIITLSYNGQIKHFRYQISSETTDIGFAACEDKGITSSLLTQAGIHTPRHFRINRTDSSATYQATFDALNKPLVIKPTHGNKGNAITTQVTSFVEFQAAVDKAFSLINTPDAGVMVEETASGNEYRVLATREEILGIVFRQPASVTGDNTHTIRQLIEVKNQDPWRGDDTFPLATIVIDQDIVSHLEKQHVTLDSVPQKDHVVFLRTVSNVSKGGDPIDFTDQAHPSVKEICVRAINAVPGIAFAGIDFMTTDITQPQTPESYAIIEINSSPGFCIHAYPTSGTARHAEYQFLKLSFPDLDISSYSS